MDKTWHFPGLSRRGKLQLLSNDTLYTVVVWHVLRSAPKKGEPSACINPFAIEGDQANSEAVGS